jgi:hypothetical protein
MSCYVMLCIVLGYVVHNCGCAWCVGVSVSVSVSISVSVGVGLSGSNHESGHIAHANSLTASSQPREISCMKALCRGV